jgi:hypothetical protein
MMDERKGVQIAVRFPPSLADAVKQVAAKERRTTADMVRLMIEDSIAARRAAQEEGAAA